jgi:hypothetical protein
LPVALGPLTSTNTKALKKINCFAASCALFFKQWMEPIGKLHPFCTFLVKYNIIIAITTFWY